MALGEKMKNDAKLDEAQCKVTSLQHQLEDLKRSLLTATEELTKLKGTPKGENGTHETPSAPLAIICPPNKRGYLCKWRDRAIGWGGTKWALRYVVLEQGRLAYYSSHTSLSQKYALHLKGCAVKDDGAKRNTRVQPNNPGEYYHVFSIYHRQESNRNTDQAEDDDESQITPLLRFSTCNLAEKMQWIELLSESCAYCESQPLSKSTSLDVLSLNTQPASPLPISQPGTLPPIFFGQPSQSKPRRMNFIKKSKLVGSSKSNSLSRIVYPPSRPMHRSAAPSYLSEEAPIQNFRGFLNLALIILFISNFRLMVDTIQKHGNVFAKIPDLDGILNEPLVNFPFISGMVLIHVFILYTFLLEKLLAKNIINEKFGMSLHLLNANLSLVIPAVIVWCFISHNPPVGGALLLLSVTTWMKLVSYLHANHDYRTSDSHKATMTLICDLEEKDKSVLYPDNITLGNIYYFWFAPTLTYQIAFPKNERIRWMKVVGILLRIMICVTLLLFLMFQTVAPNLDNLLQDLDKSPFTLDLGIKYLLQLAIPNTYIWLLVFYIFFHLYLNLFAELLRFGDRVFYKDWWNSSEVSAYWRLWNTPVHYWLVRHVYFPCIQRNYSRGTSTFLVFFISAVMHELLISVPFHTISMWSFCGIIGQIPLVALTKYLDKRNPGSSVGNVIFWISFCVVGQPMMILLYTIDFWKKRAAADNDAGLNLFHGIQDEL